MAGVRKPDRSCIGDERVDERLVGDQDGLLLLSPVGASELFE